MFFLGFGNDEADDLRPLSQFKIFHESRNSHKSDVLDSISSSYEGTRKILADSEPRGPYYVPPDIKIDYHKDFSSVDLPHPTVDIGNCFYIKSLLKSIDVYGLQNGIGDYAFSIVTYALYGLLERSNF